MTHARHDANEAGLVKLWQAQGWRCIPQARGAGFDQLIITGVASIFLIVEIKNPKLNWYFTEAEINLIDWCIEHHVSYNVVETDEDAQYLPYFTWCPWATDGGKRYTHFHDKLARSRRRMAAQKRKATK